MTTGVRPDGSEVRVPMSLRMPYAKDMTEVELQAMWAYLQSLTAARAPRARMTPTHRPRDAACAP